ncbi:hypothetical protein GCM10023219_00180 [Stakelama sediminis]|uniref:MerC mercury resistance protein n=1 Tax=Stakelama sediminis TaxID=463200 RepID=A0A840Z0U8_9SPHN|nr:MerC domain-containing protein [Stakelama sediminis]MBB5719545.1 hypothetical protein [Stakelama sediminis]
MTTLASPVGIWSRIDARIDRIAIALSGLCLVHCIASAVLLALLASAGALLDPHIHETGLALAIVLGVIGLGRGILTHGQMLPLVFGAFGLGVMAGALSIPHGPEETIFTLLGVTFLAAGHELNRRAGSGACCAH